MRHQFYASLLFALLCACSCITPSFVSVDEFMKKNEQYDIESWRGWTVLRRPGYSYYMVRVQNKNGENLHQFIFFQEKGSIIVKVIFNGSSYADNIENISQSPLWNKLYKDLKVTDLKEKVEWILTNDVDYINFCQDSLYVKGFRYAVKRGSGDNNINHGWEEWPQGKYKNN